MIASFWIQNLPSTQNLPKSEREMGEMVMDATNYDGTINYTTNWTFAGGSLPDSVSFESSFSTTTANHESDDGINPAAVDHTAKSPLLLLPPVPNGDPCEITSTVLDPPFFTFTSDSFVHRYIPMRI